jgi:hypothetical protein
MYLINFGLFSLFGLSDLEKYKPNYGTKTKLTITESKILKWKIKLNSSKFNHSVRTN